MSENEEVLTIQQQHVLTLVAQGSTVSAAADAAGVHRNTVANWRRAGSHEFRKSWDAAQFEQAAYWRDRIQALGDLAIQALQQILEDPKASPSVRLKAATTVLNTIASPTAAKTAQSAQRRDENSELDRMIAQAGHIPAHWRDNIEVPRPAAACASVMRAVATE